MKKTFGALLTLSLILSACSAPVKETDKDLITQNGVTATQDYFDFFDPTIYHELVIEVKATALDELDTLMKAAYAKFGNYRISAYVKANVVYREDGKEKIRLDEIGLRTHGNVFSRYLIEYDGTTMNPLHWRLTFDDPFDLQEGTTAYEKRKKRDLYGLENLILKWNRTAIGSNLDTDPYILESYGYSLYEQAGVPSSKATLVHVIFSVDGQEIDQGVMTMIEPVDDEFIAKRFSKDAKDGNLYKALWQMAPANLESAAATLFGIKDEEKGYYPPYDIKTNKDVNQGQDLKDLIKTIAAKSNKDLYDELSTSINLANFNAFNAMNYLYGNPDDFRYNSNNYYLYHDSSSHPQWFFIPTDLDKGLGITDWDPDGQQMKSILPYDPFTANFTFPAPLILRKTILSNFAKFKDPYLEVLRSDVNGFFDYSKFAEAYQIANALYSGDVGKNETRTTLKTMGLPFAVAKYYCVQTYKVLNLKQPTTECD